MSTQQIPSTVTQLRGEAGGHAASAAAMLVVVILCCLACGLMLLLDPHSLDVGSVYQQF